MHRPRSAWCASTGFDLPTEFVGADDDAWAERYEAEE